VAYFSDSPMPADPRAVVITGAGIISPMGRDWTENVAGFRAGKSAFSPVTLFDVSRQRVGTAGQADLPETAPDFGVSAKAWQRMDRGTRLALLAAREALENAGLSGGEMPMIIGTSAAAMPIGEAYYQKALLATTSRRHQLRRVETYQAQRQMTAMARELGITGFSRIISNACASGANAIGHAFHLVRSGKAERVLAGGYDALSQLVFAGFDTLQALSPSGIPRPFDAHRDGLALGEGAGFVVVESAASANARRAPIIAEVLGYGAATDTHHLTQPNPMGDTALATMQAACEMAGLLPEQIDYINSHGTGTPLNDIAEGNAIQRWAGDSVSKIQVSSTKSAIGHLLGGAGAVESVIALMTLEGQWLPASLNVREADPVCTFDLIREPRSAPVRRCLTNSFGFGGSNATLIFGKEGIL
jgi:3-oxoacyl-[acyl-carrier-protein] synthase II